MARRSTLRTAFLASCLGGAALLAATGSDGREGAQVAANLSVEGPIAASGPVRNGSASAAAAKPTPPPPPPRHHEDHEDIDLAGIALVGDQYRAELPGDQTAELTLDPVLQKAVEETLARAKPLQGAIVVMTPDGEVLALAGIDESGKPAPQLATDTWAPAASIFKIVTAAALVDAGVSPNKKVCYHGGLRSVTEANLRDSKRDRRCNDLGYAVAKSQNALIAKLAHRHLDADRLTKAAEAFGMGTEPSFCADAAPSPVDIPKDSLEFARVSAGFWRTELSPLGGALLANVVASRGMQVTPRIVRALISADGTRTAIEAKPGERVLPKKVADAVAEMMVGTTERGGTGYKGFHDRKGRPFLADIDVAGKTGTLTRGSPSYMQYSWFVGFAPADQPKVVISVLLGNPPKWHLKAHTAARLVLQKAF